MLLPKQIFIKSLVFTTLVEVRLSLSSLVSLKNYEVPDLIFHSYYQKYKEFYSYRSGTVNSKSFVGKVLLRIKWKFKLN